MRHTRRKNKRRAVAKFRGKKRPIRHRRLLRDLARIRAGKRVGRRALRYANPLTKAEAVLVTKAARDWRRAARTTLPRGRRNWLHGMAGGLLQARSLVGVKGRRFGPLRARNGGRYVGNPWQAMHGSSWGPSHRKPGNEERVFEFSGPNMYVGAEMSRKAGAIGPVKLHVWRSAYDKTSSLGGTYKNFFAALAALRNKYTRLDPPLSREGKKRHAAMKIGFPAHGAASSSRSKFGSKLRRSIFAAGKNPGRRRTRRR